MASSFGFWNKVVIRVLQYAHGMVRTMELLPIRIMMCGETILCWQEKQTLVKGWDNSSF